MMPPTVGALSFSRINNSLISNVEVQKEFWVQALTKEHPELAPGLIEKEVDLEISMTTEGILRYDRQTQKAAEQGNQSNTDYGRFLLRYKVKEIAEAIDALLVNVREGKAGYRSSNLRLIKDMSPRVLAYITLQRLLDFIGQEKSLHTVALEVAARIETEARLDLFKIEAPHDFELAMKRARRRPQLYNKKNSMYMIMSKKAKGEYDDGEAFPEEFDEIKTESKKTENYLEQPHLPFSKALSLAKASRCL